MFFYSCTYHTRNKKPEKYPAVSLYKDGWNDYGYYTLYICSYWPSNESSRIELGMTKILQIENKESVKLNTRIPDEFERLSNSFCSLGQSPEFYQHIRGLGEGVDGEILVGLRDIVYNSEIKDDFCEYEAFHKSLLRFSESNKALREGRIFLGYEAERESEFIFKFKNDIESSVKFNLEFDFSKFEGLPYRTIVLVGRNGSGKTTLLANLAMTISGAREKGDLLPRPVFSKAIMVSYNPYDHFEIPEFEEPDPSKPWTMKSYNLT
jgi:hypothetical protein